MIELASALTLPIAKLLLKSWLGDSVAVDVGDNLLKLGFNRFGDWAKARAAQQQANRIADAVVKDLGDFFASERVDEDALLPAAFELGETIRSNVDAAFLVSQQLKVEAITRALLDARPVDGIYRRAEPEHGLYVRLVEEIAPRLRALAPGLPDFARERDAVLLQQLNDVAAQAPKLLEELRGLHEKLDELRKRPEQLAQGFERDYLDAVAKELDYVEILGIEELDSKSRKADLTVAYLSLTARLVEGEEQQKIDFATVLTLLPLFGNRLWIEGGAGSGKSTLVRWTALQAARWRLGQAGTQDILDIAPDLYNWLDFLRPSKRGKKRGEKRNEANDGNKAEGRLLVLDREERLSRADREHPAKEALFEQAWRGRLPFVAHLRYATDRLTLGQLTKLQWLFLSRTRVASAEPLAGLSGLRQLELNDTYVRDIAPLANLAELLWLDISRTQVADVAPLASITKVERLYLSGTHVSDLAPLADLTNLVWLDLSGTPVKDAAPLANLTNLLMLDLSNTQVSKEAVAQLERALAKRGNRTVRIAVQ